MKNLIKEEKDKKIKEELQEKYKDFVETTYNTFKKEINSEDCIGGISEVYNAKAPYKPGGTCNQAWSVSEVLRIVIEYNKLFN